VAAVLEHVRQQLARERDAGAEFGDAWLRALARAVPAPDPDGWRDALRATRGAWQAAYERRPLQRSESALVLLVDNGDREPLEDAQAVAERRCRTCSGPIPSTRRRAARYCSHACQRAAHGRRVAAAA
jgi:hypothetical protein